MVNAISETAWVCSKCEGMFETQEEAEACCAEESTEEEEE